MSARSCLTIVLAAGEGTRMRASRPKVLHAIGGRSLIAHVLAAAGSAGGAQAVVVGPAQDAVVAAVKAAAPGAELFVQSERRGTAHAVLAAKPALARGADDILVVFADTPLMTPADPGAAARRPGAGRGGGSARLPAGRPDRIRAADRRAGRRARRPSARRRTPMHGNVPSACAMPA